MVKKTVLVTGASGFIGRNLTKELLGHGFIVIVLDRTDLDDGFVKYSCMTESCMKDGDFDLITVKGDIRDERVLCKLFQNYDIDYVVHLAALSTIQLGALNKAETFSINVEGTRILLESVRKYGKLRGFLYASTDKVYGRLQSAAYTETDELIPVDSFYDQSKAQADQMVREWFVKYGIHTVVLRFCNIYGEYDLQNTRVIPGNIQACLENRSCTLRVYQDAQGRIRNYQRDFLYVGDLCKSIRRIIEKLELWNQDAQTAAWGEAFNLGTGRSYSMDEVIQRIRRIAGSEIPIKIENTGMVEEIAQQCMNYTKAHKYCGFTPLTSLEEGLQRTVIWWKRRK